MMAVRLGMYKAHYWTWTNSIQEFNHVCKLLMSNVCKIIYYMYFMSSLNKRILKIC